MSALLDCRWLRIDGRLRVKDVELGARLGMRRPTNIRSAIKRRLTELEAFGPVLSRTIGIVKGSAGRPPSAVYYLTEEQALLIAAQSTAPRAQDVRFELIAAVLAAAEQQGGAPGARGIASRILAFLRGVVSSPSDDGDAS